MLSVHACWRVPGGAVVDTRWCINELALHLQRLKYTSAKPKSSPQASSAVYCMKMHALAAGVEIIGACAYKGGSMCVCVLLLILVNATCMGFQPLPMHAKNTAKALIPDVSGY